MLAIPKGWSKDGEKLVLVLKCPDFKHAVALLNSIGDIAEKLNHHPDLGVRNYNEVLVSTTTHSENSLTKKDFELAREINDLLEYQKTKERIEQEGR